MLLKGVKVLDLSNLLPGPMCSLFLADLGAEVIKIESLKGDFMRSISSNKNKTPYFSSLNRNKKSIALNLKTSEGKYIFMKLAKNADVIIESFRPGKVDSLGIGYNNVKKINPRIIYCSITGYGQKGFYKDKAGHDLNYSALSGLLDVLFQKPAVPGVQIADVGCALTASFSIVSSLFYREKSHEGNYIDVSIFRSIFPLMSIHIAQKSLSGKKTVLSGAPCYNVYETKDKRFVSLGAIESKFWQSFCNAVKRKDLLQRQFDNSIFEVMKIFFKGKTMDEWLKLNEKYDFCCEPVRKIEEIIKDKSLKNRNILIELDGITQASMPVEFSSFGKINYARAPKIGEHTEKILRSIGYNDNVIKKLKIKSVIR